MKRSMKFVSHRILAIGLLATLSACSFQSSQWNTAKSLATVVKNIGKPAVAYDETPLWIGEIGKQRITFFAEGKPQGVRFVSQDGIEIDFDTTLFSVVAVRNWLASQDFIKIKSSDGLLKELFRNGELIGELQCLPFEPSGDKIFARHCYGVTNFWRHTDIIKLNEDNLIVSIQTAVLPDEPLITLTWSQSTLIKK